jgi:tRNA(fMet)-specific endonuclease VapC
MTIIKDYLLDTNIVRYLYEIKSELLSAKSEKVNHRLEKIKNRKIFLSPISAGEIEYGLLIAFEKDLAKQRIVKEIVNSFEYFPIDKVVATQYYAELRKRLYLFCKPTKKRKRIEQWMNPETSEKLRIQENDLWIAAVAMTHNLILVTDDKMEIIKKVSGIELQFENWCE